MTDVSARWVLHLDMDAFFAAAEQLTRPTLRDRPVLVGGLGPRAVVAGASYQARVFGARSAMPMGQARRRCPHAVVVPPRGGLYRVLSEEVMAVLAEAAPIVEPVSLDEAFLEPPALAGASAAEVERFGVALRAAVRERTGLPASVGAGSGKQLAKIASELAKPDGLRVVAPAEEAAVLAPLPVRALWGVGPVAGEGLRRLGVHTVGELAAMDLRELAGLLGTVLGTELHQLARGIDDRPVARRGAAKQVSAETTFDVDLTAMTAVHEAVARMAEAAHRRLVESGRAARTVTVKIRSADFSTVSRSETSAIASTDLAALTAVAQRLARAAVPAGGVRLIGVSLAGLSDNPPPALFEPPAPEPFATPAAAAAPSAGARPATSTLSHAGATIHAGPAVSTEAAAATGTTAHAGPGVSTEAATGTTPSAGTTTHAGPGVSAEAAAHTGISPRTGATAGTGPAFHSGAPVHAEGPAAERRTWRPGDDVRHVEHGHGWVQGAGHGRVTVRFETRSTGPGRAITLPVDDPALALADALDSLR